MSHSREFDLGKGSDRADEGFHQKVEKISSTCGSLARKHGMTEATGEKSHHDHFLNNAGLRVPVL